MWFHCKGDEKLQSLYMTEDNKQCQLIVNVDTGVPRDSICDAPGEGNRDMIYTYRGFNDGGDLLLGCGEPDAIW